MCVQGALFVTSHLFFFTQKESGIQRLFFKRKQFRQKRHPITISRTKKKKSKGSEKENSSNTDHNSTERVKKKKKKNRGQ